MPANRDNSVSMDFREGQLGRTWGYDNGLIPVQQNELLMIDSTGIGGDLFCITSMPQLGQDGTTNELYFIDFQGNRFYYIPFETDGFEWSGNGSLPTPTITVADFSGNLLNTIYDTGNLIGAKVRRWLAVDDFNFRGPEEFIVIQKSESTNSHHTFKLGTILTARNSKLPQRNMFRDDFPGMQRFS